MKMTKEEAKIIVLENALLQAYNSIEFLHKCLIHKERYSYDYPEKTHNQLIEIEKLIEISHGCFHSKFHEDCLDCNNSLEKFKKLEEAKRCLES